MIMKTLFLAVMICWGSMAWAGSPGWIWAQQGDVSTATALAGASAVATDAAGNAYVAGTFKGTIRIGSVALTASSGYSDVFLAKFDSQGSALWAAQAGGMSCSAGGLATDGVEVFMTGACMFGAQFGAHALAASATYESAFFLVAANAGNGAFSRLLAHGGSSGMKGNALTLDANGALLVAGSFNKTASILGAQIATAGGNDEDAFVFKVNKAFDQLAWLRSGGGGSSDHAYAVATDASGNVVIAGDFASNVATDTASFGNTTLTVPAYRSGDAFVAKLNGDGEWLWAKSISGRAFDEARAVATDNAGNVYVAGRFSAALEAGSLLLEATALNSYAVFMTKLDAAGNFIWAQQAGSTNNAALSDHASAYGLVVRGNGNPVMAGHYRAETAFGTTRLTALNMSDVFVAELDASNGQYLWVKSGGGASGNDSGNALALAADGTLRIAGSFEDSASFDSTTLATGRSDYWVGDLFLAALNPEAEPGVTMLSGTMSASGPLSARTLSLDSIGIPTTDLAGGVSLYVAANVGGSYYFLTPSGWTTSLLAYAGSVTSAPASISITSGLDLSGLVGTTVWLGYGRGSADSALNDMLQSGRYRQVYTIQ